MTGNFSTDVLVVYIPAVLVLVMAVLGALRGAKREAVVSGSIVLAALIILVWGASWGSDLSTMFSGLSLNTSILVLAYVVIGLVVLVCGYMLGSALVARTPMSAMSRVGGILLGIANALAIAGFIIRLNFDVAGTDFSGANAEFMNTLRSNTVSASLWIWSNWFPLAVAILAAVVALVGPFRRTQSAVATPSATTDWGPSTAPAAMAAPGPAAYTTGYGQGFTSQYPQQPAQPQYGQQYGQPAQYGQQYHQQYGASQAPTQQYAVPAQPNQPSQSQYGQYAPYSQPAASTPPPVSQPLPYTPPTSYTPAPAVPSREEDAPPTVLMPKEDMPRSAPAGGQETLYFGATAATNKDTDPQLKAPEWPGYSTEPSWLSPSPSASSSMPASSASSSTPSVDNSIVARSEAPTEAQPLIVPASASSSAVADTSASNNTPPDSDTASFVNCSRCGTLVPSDATFCTECGNKMK